MEEAVPGGGSENAGANERAPRPPMKTTREKAEEKRQAKLDFIREQLENGDLVIRQMTEEERRRYPPRPPQPKRFERR